MDKKPIHFVRCLKCQKILQCSRYDTSVLLQHIRSDHPEIEIVDGGSYDKIKDTKYRNQQGKPLNQTSNKANGGQENHKSEKNLDLAKGEESATNRSCECNRNSAVNLKTNENNFNQVEGNGYYVPEIDTTQLPTKSELSEKSPQIKKSNFEPPDANANVIYIRRYKIKTPTTTTNASSTPPGTTQRHNNYRTTIEKWRPANGTIYCPKCGCNKRPLIKTRTERFADNQCCAFCLFSCWPFCFVPCLIPDSQVEYLHCSNCKTFLGIYNRNSNCIKPNREYVKCVNNVSSLTLDNKLKSCSSEYHESTSDIRNQMPTGKQLPSIVIDGKELHPDMVARLQRYRKYGHLAGIGLDAVTNGNDGRFDTSHYVDSFRDGIPSQTAPSDVEHVRNKAY